MFSDIQVICFDLDDTLWPCRPVIQRAEQRLYGWLTEQAPALAADYSMEDMRLHRLEFQRDNPDIAHDLTRVRQQALQQLTDAYGYHSSLSVQGVALFREARNQVTPYPDVLPVLSRLLARYRIVSVTNGNAEIRKTSLSNFFHRSFTAAEVGAARPDPALFQAVLDWSEKAPGAVLHVGDDPARDVGPAKRLGMRTALMQRGQCRESGEAQPGADVVVRDLHQLVALLDLETLPRIDN